MLLILTRACRPSNIFLLNKKINKPNLPFFLFCTLFSLMSPMCAQGDSVSDKFGFKGDVKILNEELKTADDVEMYVIPRGTDFITRVRPRDLREFACKYVAKESRFQPQIVAEVIGIINKNVEKYDAEQYKYLDIRIGIDIKKRDKIIFALNSEDYSNSEYIRVNYIGGSGTMRKVFANEIRGLIAKYGINSTSTETGCK